MPPTAQTGETQAQDPRPLQEQLAATLQHYASGLTQRDKDWQAALDAIAESNAGAEERSALRFESLENAMRQLTQGTTQAGNIAQQAGQAATQGQRTAEQANLVANQAAQAAATGVLPNGAPTLAAGHQTQAIPTPAPVKPPQPPKFKGADKSPRILEWTHQAGQFLKSAGLEHHVTGVWHITNFLSDEAAVWWRLYCADVENGRAPMINNWAELKNLMLSRFTEINRIVAIKDRYHQLSQTGSVSTYISRFRELVVELPDETEWDRVYQFLKGLKPAIQANTRTHKPKTLEQAMDIADEADRAIYRANNRGGSRAYPNSGGQGRGNGPKPMDLGAVTLSDQEKQRCIRDGLCFICKKPDHAARDCPDKPAGGGGRGQGGRRGRKRGGRGRRRQGN